MVAVNPVDEARPREVVPVTVREVTVVVANVEVPVTASVPCETREVVAVMVPPVILAMVEESAERMLVKKFVVVAAVNVGVSVSA